MAWMIGRPINGVTINGNEYVCDDDGITILFPTEEEAREFVHAHGYTDEMIEDEGIVFEFVEEEDDEVQD